MAVVGTQSPTVDAESARYHLYGRMSSQSAPGPILEVGLESTQPCLYPRMRPGKMRSKLKRNRRLQIERSSKSQVLLETSLLSSLLDNPVLISNYEAASKASGLQNVSTIQEHFRVQSPPLFFSTSCPCNMEYLSYSLPAKKCHNRLVTQSSRGSVESSPSPEPSPVEAGTSKNKVSSKKSPPKSSTPKSSLPKFSPPGGNHQREKPSNQVETTPALQDSTNARKKSSPSSEISTESSTSTPKDSLNGSTDSSSGDVGKCTRTESKKRQDASKTGTLRTSGLQEQSTCRRNLLKEFEANLTFKPAMNNNSLKIAARTMRKTVPLEQRLLERKTNNRRNLMDRDYTFSPHLNPYSIRLARHRASRQQEV